MDLERMAKLGAIDNVLIEFLDEMVAMWGKDKKWINKYPEKFLSAIEQVEIDYDAIDAAQANRVKEFAE